MKVTRALLAFAFVSAIAMPAMATPVTIGSMAAPRATQDLAAGELFIYAGDVFAPGLSINSMVFSWFTSASGRYVTPVLLQESAGVFTLKDVGTSVLGVTGAQSTPFALQYGPDTVTGVNYTFGFVESQVNSSGIVVAPNAGGVDFSLTVDPGTGVSGGSSSNRWLFTPFVTGFGSAVTLPIGLTFYTPGNSGNYALDNNSPGVGNSDRTYSANMTATATPVPEPSTMILIALGLVGVASVRRRHREG